MTDRNTPSARIITFRVPPDVLHILDTLQAHSGVDRTEVIVSLIRIKGRELVRKLPKPAAPQEPAADGPQRTS